jgi:CheY-like chemotaxis protein
LEGLGHLVSGTPSSGTQAIEMANSAAADLLLVDMAVEGAMHGVAAADVIRRHRPVPVVFIGAGTTEATLVAAGMARPFGVLEPPFSERELRLTLELAWERFNASRAVHELEAFFAISNDMFCFL